MDTSASFIIPGEPAGLVATARGLGAEGARLAALQHAAARAARKAAVLKLRGAWGAIQRELYLVVENNQGFVLR